MQSNSAKIPIQKVTKLKIKNVKEAGINGVRINEISLNIFKYIEYVKKIEAKIKKRKLKKPKNCIGL